MANVSVANAIATYVMCLVLLFFCFKLAQNFSTTDWGSTTLWRPELTGDRFPLPVNTGRVDGPSTRLVETEKDL